MGIETLQSAARAAGFAMAASDEPLTEARREVEAAWRPTVAAVPRQQVEITVEKASFGDWVKSVMVGRAPA